MSVNLFSAFRNYRVAKRDTDLCGTRVRAGERLMFSSAAANRDPEVFDDPDALRPERSRSPASPRSGAGIRRAPHGFMSCISLADGAQSAIDDACAFIAKHVSEVHR